MNNDNLARYYKQRDELVIDGIDYARVIATRTYNITLKNRIKEFVRLCVFDYKIKYNSQNNNLLTVYSYKGKGRKDYDDILSRFIDMIDSNTDTIYFICGIEAKHCFIRLKNFIYIFIKLLKGRIKHPFFAACLTAQFLHWKKNIHQRINFKKYKLLTTFCDAHGIENLITQIANQYCITATLQHGQYRVLKPETENADVEAYENFSSDYLFAWGEVTKEEFIKVGINKERILVVGALKPFSNNVKITQHNSKKVFGVILDGNIYHQSNIEMIKVANKLAEKYNLKFILRMHPKNEESLYITACNTRYLLRAIKGVENQKYANEVDFSIIHMTGVFVELLSINSPMFLYDDKYLEDIFKIDGSTFTDFLYLDKLYNIFDNDREKFSYNQYKLYRRFNAAGNVKENYCREIQNLLK